MSDEHKQREHEARKRQRARNRTGVAGIALMSAGAGWWIHPGAGLLLGGSILLGLGILGTAIAAGWIRPRRRPQR